MNILNEEQMKMFLISGTAKRPFAVNKQKALLMTRFKASFHIYNIVKDFGVPSAAVTRANICQLPCLNSWVWFQQN